MNDTHNMRVFFIFDVGEQGLVFDSMSDNVYMTDKDDVYVGGDIFLKDTHAKDNMDQEE